MSPGLILRFLSTGQKVSLVLQYFRFSLCGLPQMKAFNRQRACLTYGQAKGFFFFWRARSKQENELQRSRENGNSF